MQFTTLSNGFSHLASAVGKQNRAVSSDVGKLSSGQRIVRAADDVANLSIATRLQTQNTALRSVISNLGQAGSLLQVADDALNDVSEILQRMQQLGVMANGGAISNTERAFLDIEFQSLREEIDDIFEKTTFNGVKIFGGIQGIQEEDEVEEVDNTLRSLIDIVDLETGNYELDTGNTQFTGYVENDGTSSWLLVGRGREGWEFDGDGQGTTASVITGLGTTAAFAPAAYDPTIINDMINNAGLDLTDVEIRIKRAANTTGTEYQEARWRPISQTSWTWDFDGANYAVEHEVAASSLGAAFTDNDSLTRDTLSTPGPDTGNNYQRIWTFDWPGKGNIPGFSYGSAVAGTNGNDPNTFLWENTTENHATPYTEVYIRLKNPPAAAPAPASSSSASELSEIDNLFIWLDAADIDGDNVSEGLGEAGLSGSNVTSWANKAGGVAAQQGAGVNQPTVALTGLNSSPTIRFDGANDWLGLNLNTPETNYTQFVVYQSTDASGAFTTVVNPVTNNAGSHDRQFGLNGGQLYNRLWNTEIIQSATAGFNDGAGHIASITVDSTSGQRIEADSASVATGVKTSSDFNFDLGFLIGGHSFLGPYQGDIAEIIMFDRVLTADEYEVVEGYLAHKWDLTANLPNNHAYKLNSPFAAALDDLEFSVSEDAKKGTIVGQVGDGYEEGISYSFAPFDEEIEEFKGIFDINPATGEISVVDEDRLDYESFQSLELTVEIIDAEGSTRQQQVTITIEDVNESEIIFQIGNKAEQQLVISIAKLDTSLLFDDADPGIRRQGDAAEAINLVREAIDRVTERRAYYGSLQSSVGFLNSAKTSELQNQTAARARLADTDIASTSTEYLLNFTQLSASISISAQTNRLREDVTLQILEEGIQVPN